MGKRLIIITALIIFTVFQFLPLVEQDSVTAKSNQSVYIVPVEQGIERGLERFLSRAFAEADKYRADVIILEIDTLGGTIDAALEIGDLIQRENIPTVAYIKGEAISAGSYISLSADKIYMQPNSFIGAAAVRTISGDEVDPKITSWWASHMINAAKLNGKNPEVAEGKVNPNVEIPDLSKKGELITLNSNQALEYGIADGIVKSRAALFTELGLDNPTVTEVKLSPSEQVARFVTNPYVMPLLLMIGIAGILIELFVPGFGLPGIIGISSFGLYFFGHIFAGFAGWESILLFIAGFILLSIEVFVPGFGIFGVLGIISISGGIALAAYETTYGLISLFIAFIVNIILTIILVKYFGKRGAWNKFILKEEQKKETGYVSHNKDRSLTGKRGKTVTKLRPSGIAIIEGKRYDVVSEGSFIDANTAIEVLMVEGTRIVVGEIE